MQRAAQGDLAAFGRLVERYQAAVYACCVDRLQDADAARDAAQESFLRAFDRLGALREPAAFGGWLRRIAQRIAIDHARRESRRLDRAALPPEGPAVLPAPAGAGEDVAAVRQAVAALPERLRLVVRLRYQEGLSYEEIADFCGITSGAVGVRLHRARRALRGVLKEPVR